MGSKLLMTSIFPETFAPPKTAISGLFGEWIALSKYAISFSINNPAAFCVKYLAIPSVEACALCAVPKASLIYISPKSASLEEKS